MTSNLIKPDLSKDTTGPFVTRATDAAEFMGQALDGGFIFRTGGDLWSVDRTGRCALAHSLDIFLAPKEPRTVFVPWFDGGWTSGASDTLRSAIDTKPANCLAILQLEVDDQGVPVHNSVVRRVEG